MSRMLMESDNAIVEPEPKGQKVDSPASIVSVEMIPVGTLLERKELEGIRLLRIIRSDGSVSVKVVEPFTWTAAAWAICSGILAYVGAEVFKNAIGARSLSDLLHDAIQKIGQLVRQAIAENEARKIGDQVANLDLNYRTYLNSPAGGKLERLLYESNLTAEGADSLGLLTAGHLAVCGSLELALYQEAFQLSKAAGDKANIVMVADHLTVKIPPLI